LTFLLNIFGAATKRSKMEQKMKD